MSDRDVHDWVRDSSLFFRLRDSVITLIRGAGKFEDRANYAVERLRPITINAFPKQFHPTWIEIENLVKLSVWYGPEFPILKTSRLSPMQRSKLTCNIFYLYEEMLKFRSKLE